MPNYTGVSPVITNVPLQFVGEAETNAANRQFVLTQQALLKSVTINADGPPTGADLIVLVKSNGSDVGTGPFTLTAGQTYVRVLPSATTVIPAAATINVSFSQVGSIDGGFSIAVTLELQKIG